VRRTWPKICLLWKLATKTRVRSTAPARSSENRATHPHPAGLAGRLYAECRKLDMGVARRARWM
jgi:hypothetical protein